jgi:hypothetical protein
MGPRDSLEAVAKRKNPIIAPAGNGTPVVQPVMLHIAYIFRLLSSGSINVFKLAVNTHAHSLQFVDALYRYSSDK